MGTPPQTTSPPIWFRGGLPEVRLINIISNTDIIFLNDKRTSFSVEAQAERYKPQKLNPKPVQKAADPSLQAVARRNSGRSRQLLARRFAARADTLLMAALRIRIGVAMGVPLANLKAASVLKLGAGLVDISSDCSGTGQWQGEGDEILRSKLHLLYLAFFW